MHLFNIWFILGEYPNFLGPIDPHSVGQKWGSVLICPIQWINPISHWPKSHWYLKSPWLWLSPLQCLGNPPIPLRKVGLKVFFSVCRDILFGQRWQRCNKLLKIALPETKRYSLLCGLSSHSCGGPWTLAEAFYAVFAYIRPFFVFSSNISNF